MDIKEANKVLEELSKDVRPEILNDKAKGLFDAIMKIADERDEIKSDLYEANNRIVDLMDIIDKKDKIINELEEKIEYLEKENKVVRIFKKSMPKDIEIVVMTKVNFEKNFKKEENK